MTAVLDTNALMMPVECDVRVFEELQRLLGAGEWLVPEAVVAELEDLSAGAGEEATAASVGLDLVDRCTVRDHAAEYADDAVLELASDLDAYAVTNDGPLKQRLLDADVPVIGLRGRNKLAITQS
ncbi:PIN domain-containing protein [Halorhabdus amylolytica]|uniref:PIN domain-containing protein n=1 Tax=Halorhabdus amylolytica TaxID=2559573 RepID=UPI0010A9FAEE|nr:twitching motility protein PilT [Halorhabdus amylolytica]